MPEINDRMEFVILENLIRNEEYTKRVLPFIKEEYFKEKFEQYIFKAISEFISKYNTNPSVEILEVELQANNTLSQNTLEICKRVFSNIKESKKSYLIDWLIENTEKFIKDKALYNAIEKSIQILDSEDDSVKEHKSAIPEIVKAALAVGFDVNVGHDYILDANERYEYYHRKESKVPFHLKMLNKITAGGLSRKTLNIAMAGCVSRDTLVNIRFRKKSI